MQTVNPALCNVNTSLIWTSLYHSVCLQYHEARLPVLSSNEAHMGNRYSGRLLLRAHFSGHIFCNVHVHVLVSLTVRWQAPTHNIYTHNII